VFKVREKSLGVATLCFFYGAEVKRFNSEFNPMFGKQGNLLRKACFWSTATVSLFTTIAAANTSIHTTWLWHLHQPVYWPDRRVYGTDHYEAAWDTIQQQDAGRNHPSPEVLRNIFGLDDRIAAYQYRPKDALASIGGYLNSGVQISYSGALMENVQSLGSNNQLGYGPGWYQSNHDARQWTTTWGKPRMDLVNFNYHHALAPLLSAETLEMELRIHQRHMDIIWGTSPAHSAGYFPPETCFAEYMIPVLKKVGINWSVVANNHLSRTCADFPFVAGSGGENCDIPNKADQLNPAQGTGNYKRISIDRGVSPAAAMPFAFQTHYARYVDPATGTESKIVVVPADQALGWKDSYGTWDVGLLDDLNARNNPNKPSLVLLAHDGDNAWSGGYSYYMEWVSNFAGQAAGRGYEPSSVEQHLAEFPPASSDVVHVEPGGWEYADGDFGSPIFINWHWPPSYQTNGVNKVDPSVGVSDKADVWRVIVATENRVKTAQQISGITPNIDQVRDPGSFGGSPNGVELGWHYYLAGLDSGFVYYGCHDDECLRPIKSQDNAVRNVNGYLNDLTNDHTPPTIFIPQRSPWNPGTTNFGNQYSYRITVPTNSDFFVWTYAYDVSGIANVVLKYRLDGANPPTQDQFKTYAGGPNTCPWSSITMAQRSVAPILGSTPQYIADYYWTKVTGLSDTYVDYYVEATDNKGNTYKSPIQHVYVAANNGAPPSPTGCNGRVYLQPATPTAGQSVTIQYDASNSVLSGANPVYIHLGYNSWNPTLPDAAMTFNASSNLWEYTTIVTNIATELDCVFNDGASTWDSNNGNNWVFAVNPVPLPPATPTNLTATAITTNQINIAWTASAGADAYTLNRDGVTIATLAGTSYSDTTLLAGSNYCYTVAATNSVGSSAFSSSACATTPLFPPPGTPQNVNATALATNRIDIAWDSVSGATGYVLRRGGSTIATLAGTVYSDTGLAAGQQFCYTVVATNTTGSSTDSTPACATTFPPVPSTPENLTTYAVSATGINLTWSLSTNAAGYIVSRGGTTVGSTSLTSYNDTGLATNTQYCYTVIATNSTGSSAVSSSVCAQTWANPKHITIGPGPALGTDKRGVTWYEEFQDWTTNDLRAVSPNNNEYALSDNYDTSRDLIAFYSRQEGSNYYLRVDFFDLQMSAENGYLDLYVALNYTTGGQSYMPDNLNCNTDHPWNLCIKLYDATNAAVVTPSSDATSGNWLGSYWNSQLDSVEFGIKTNAMVGWDGVSPVHFQIFTTKDFNHFGNQTDLLDVIGGTLVRNVNNTGIGMLTGAIDSTNTCQTAKYAAIAHANQSLGARTQTQHHIYTARPDLDLYPGFVRTLDTHTIFNVPLNMHISGTLLSSFLWARQDPSEPGYPERDGPTFLNRVKEMLQNGTGSLIGGTFAEHIMPYFEGPANQSSIDMFNQLAYDIFGLTTNDMKVMHVPERVFQSNTNWPHADPNGPLKGRPFDDILATGYTATYFDEVTHLHWWFYSDETNYFTANACGEKWAGFGGVNDRQYHHKLHKINGVLCFMINDREDQEKFGPEDGGMAKDTRYTLLDKALQANDTNNAGGYAQITLVFDDWEAYAGNSFASSTPNNNADQWNTTVRWAANHPWIQMVNLKDVVTWAQTDPNWIYEDHPNRYNLGMQTYEYLKRSSEQDYDHWYWGTSLEQSFTNRAPAGAPSGWTFGTEKKYGDMNTPGTLIRDSWDKVASMPPGKLRTLAEQQYAAMIYETAWHDEDADPNTYHSRNYQLNFDVNDGCTTSTSDTTYDSISGWALRLHGHIRQVGILADVANWVQSIKNGTQLPSTTVQVADIDDDLWSEYILKNDKVYLCFKRWGGRLVAAFTYDPVSQDAVEVIGQPVANPAEETDAEDTDNNRCSAFKDRWATGTATHTNYVDMDYALNPVIGSNFFEFASSDSNVTKRVILPSGRDAVEVRYSLSPVVGTLYVRHGLGPNQLDLVSHGDTHLSTQTDGSYYYGLVNSQGGSVFAVDGANCARSIGNLPQAGFENRELPLVEQVEQYNYAGSTSFSMWLAFSQAAADDIDGDGIPNALEASLGSDYENPDTDGNGLPDGWEYNYFHQVTGTDPNADPDGDGMSNRQEYLAGTTPTDATSVFKILSTMPDTNGTMTITWSCVPGKRYQVYFRDSLNSGPDWQLVIPDSILATTTTTNYVTTISGNVQRFYKVGVVNP
jgi:hypothetical protein